MVKTIKLDKHENYLIDTVTNNLLDKYDPSNKNIRLVIKLDDSELVVDSSRINIEYGNLITVKYGDTKFIIDDGYQNILTKAGYIVYSDYDEVNIMDKAEGVEMRSKIMDKITTTIDDLFGIYCENNTMEYKESDNNEFCVSDGFYNYWVVLDTVNGIVNKNQLRKDNSLAFYPFDKKMDKYGTIYISIFVERIANDLRNADNKFSVCDNIIKDIINHLGSDYHFITQQVKRRVVKARGI